MPGCTVRGCSNSSAKGFKVHHFPSDLRRRLMWIKNCEREPTWEPSKYTCICEVHFESTQFESHRADGLQRLKPNAVPTLFNSRKSGSTCKSRNRRGSTIHEREEVPRWSLIPERAEVPDSFLDAESCTDKLSPKRSSAASLTIETASNELTVEGEFSNKFATTFADHNYPKGRPMYFQVQHSAPTDLTQAVGADLFGMSPAISFEPSQSHRHNSLQESKLLVKIKHSDPVSSRANYSKSFSLLKGQDKVADISEISTDKRSYACFLCSEDISGVVGKDPNTERLATKAHAHLVKLLSDEPSLAVNWNKDLLCSHCTGLLSYVGRLETEASIINKAILNNLRRNNDIGLGPGDFTLGDIGWQNIVGRCDPKDEHWTDGFPNVVSQSSSTDLTPAEGTALVVEERPVEDQYECRLCNFQTPYRSLLIYHLRQHLTSSLVCDYCSTFLTEHDAQNSTEQSERQVSCVNQSVVGGSHKDFPVKVHGIQDNGTVTSCDFLISVETKNLSCKSMVGPSESMPSMQSSFQLISEETSETDPYLFLKEEMYQQCVSDENIENNVADLPGEVPANIFETNF